MSWSEPRVNDFTSQNKFAHLWFIKGQEVHGLFKESFIKNAVVSYNQFEQAS